MSKMREWVTVEEAALIADRDKSRVYAWISQGKLTADERADGVTMVRSGDVARVASVTRRGRPRGTASRNRRSDTPPA